ncbi:AAA family ATPase [Candidatus Lokiarchaeum ossiferum]
MNSPKVGLTAIKFENILSYQKASFDRINQLGLIIGPNNSGKSNLFRFLKQFRFHKIVDSNLFRSGKKSTDCGVEMTFRFNGAKLQEIWQAIEEHFSPETPKNIQEHNIVYHENEISCGFMKFFKKIQMNIKFDGEGKSYITYLGPKITLHGSGILDESRISEKYNFLHSSTYIRKTTIKFYLVGINEFVKISPITTDMIQLNNMRTTHDVDQYLGKKEMWSLGLYFFREIFQFFDNIHPIEDVRQFQANMEMKLIHDPISPNGNNFPQKLFQYYNIREKQPILDKLDLLLKQFYSNITEIGQDLSTGKIIPFVREHNKEDLTNFDFLGKGLKDLVIILTHLLESDEKNILLIEEPEGNLHPKLQKILFNVIQDFLPGKQILISTHSIFFFSQIRSKVSVHEVLRREDFSTVKRLDREEFILTSTRLGVSPADLLTYDKLIFVEGITDKEAFNNWFFTLGMNPEDLHIGFVVLNGIKSFTHYAASATMNFLQDQGMKMWFIIDRDENSDYQIQKFKEKLSDFKNSNLIILKRRELENYVLNPIILTRYLVQQFNLTDVESKKIDLNKAIFDAGPDLVQKRVFAELCNPIYFNDKKIFKTKNHDDFLNNFQEQCDNLIEIIKNRKVEANDTLIKNREAINNLVLEAKEESIFEIDNELLSIIRGAEVLDILFHQVGKSYKKNRDLGGITKLQTKEEIFSEIKEMLQAIVNS